MTGVGIMQGSAVAEVGEAPAELLYVHTTYHIPHTAEGQKATASEGA